MDKIEEALWSDYQKISNQIDDLGIGNEKSQVLFDERDNIRNELITVQSNKQTYQIESDKIVTGKEQEKKRNIITIGTFAVTTWVSLYTIIKTFKFDEVSTITSTLGRTGLTNAVPKIFKH